MTQYKTITFVQKGRVALVTLNRPDSLNALNAEIMAKYRPAMRKLYYDQTRYPSYLAQLGVTYPTVRAPDGSCPTAGGQTP